MVLDLSKNRLNSLPKALKSLVSLQTLDMGENSVIERNTMALLEVQMSGSLLTRIPEESSSSLASLRIQQWHLSCLDTSHSEVPSLDTFKALVISCLDTGSSQLVQLESN